MKKLVFCISFLLKSIVSFGQNMDLSRMDVLLQDTLISKSDFVANVNTLSSSRAKHLVFRPTTDGAKSIYYLSGSPYAQGTIKNGVETGLWTYWHRNGQKAREGSFVNGRREGNHTYWYDNGKLRGTGGFKNDLYEGIWIMYNEDGTQQESQTFHAGKPVK